MIASYPAEQPIAVYPSPPISNPGQIITYNANLELEVSNVDKAAKKAELIANTYGGYLLSSQTWFQEGEKHISVSLSVPAASFESARSDLLRLGRLLFENVSGELTPSDIGVWNSFSNITIHFHPKTTPFASISLPEWRPARTFLNAWEVFTAIFGFLLDVVIWIVVVLGPFFLMAWLARKFLQRNQKP